MARRTGNIIAGFLLAMTCATLWAQQVAKPVKKQTAQKADKTHVVSSKKSAMLIPRTYLGHSDFSGGNIRYTVFDSLLQQGLFSRDSAGRSYRVVSFHFNYAERKLYEDSVGNMLMMIDYSSEPCFGNMVDTIISARIFDRVKGGDTVYIEQVLLTQETTPVDTFLGRGMKCVIGK